MLKKEFRILRKLNKNFIKKLAKKCNNKNVEDLNMSTSSVETVIN